MRWHRSPDTGFEIQALVVWGRARYLSVTGAPHNITFLQVSIEETIFFFGKLKARVGYELPISDFPSRRFNHCTTAQDLQMFFWN